MKMYKKSIFYAKKDLLLFSLPFIEYQNIKFHEFYERYNFICTKKNHFENG